VTVRRDGSGWRVRRRGVSSLRGRRKRTMSHQIRSNLRLLWVVRGCGCLCPLREPCQRPGAADGRTRLTGSIHGRWKGCTALADVAERRPPAEDGGRPDDSRHDRRRALGRVERIRNPLAEVARMNLRDRVSKAASHSTWGLVACTSFGLASGAHGHPLARRMSRRYPLPLFIDFLQPLPLGRGARKAISSKSARQSTAESQNGYIGTSPRRCARSTSSSRKN